MGSVPVLKPREVVELLKQHGFVEIRQRGSHRQFRHADGRSTTVPFHAGRDISPTLLRKIARDIGLTVEQFLSSMRVALTGRGVSPPIDVTLHLLGRERAVARLQQAVRRVTAA